ncbi:hypothetical protein Pyn_15125 [Prunus yedoensis var. nudiflora]|uniref:Uncharacterized protein n=1 Tax=Prunus yedoensis var. nudiflora TaxID=2094558 RepID=A0A314ZEQ5_PRUYE|nr:hypothetical protein Pyn_15125 [Prunus yedoensis var. nudiflora]
MEGKAAMRLTLVLALVLMTLLAPNQHIGVEAVRTVFTPSPAPSPDASTYKEADCQGDCIAQLKAQYASSQCVEVDEGVVCVCFTN